MKVMKQNFEYILLHEKISNFLLCILLLKTNEV